MFEWIREHPLMSAGLGMLAFLVIYFLFFRSAGSQQPVLTQQPADNSLAIATMAQQLGMQQTNNALTAEQGQVQAAKDVSLAQIAATIDTNTTTLADALTAHLSDNTTSIANTTTTTGATVQIAQIGATRDTSLANTAASIQANNNVAAETLAGLAATVNEQNNQATFNLFNTAAQHEYDMGSLGIQASYATTDQLKQLGF